MRIILEIARFTFIENLKKKNFIILFIYILIIFGSGILFSMLSPLQEIRIIFDIGIAAIEIFAFLSCAFISVRIILQEMEEKTVYLILSRPVSRSDYILGRFVGIISVMITYIMIMSLSLCIMLLIKGWSWNPYFIGIIISIILKIFIVTAFSILLSLISTSSASSFISIFFLWTLGHFAEELKYLNYLLKQSEIKATFLLKSIYYLIPNFSKLNYKDFFHVKEVASADFLWLVIYAVCYTLVLLLLSIIIFRKKEL